MELNGITNILLRLYMMREDSIITNEVYNLLKTDLDLLERYLMAYNEDKSINWHDVRDNPSAFPNSNER